jgi:hypothetical protein
MMAKARKARFRILFLISLLFWVKIDSAKIEINLELAKKIYDIVCRKGLLAKLQISVVVKMAS